MQTTVAALTQRTNPWLACVVASPVRFLDPWGLSADDASITIKSGDTLSQRTVQYNREHGTNYTWQEVAEYNNLATPHLIHPGDVITFPSAPVQPEQPAPTVSAPSVPQPQAPKPAVSTPVYSAPAVSTGTISSPSGGGGELSLENSLDVANNLNGYAELVTSSAAASLKAQYNNSFTNTFSDILTPNGYIRNVQTRLPMPTIETPVLAKRLNTANKISKGISAISWTIAGLDTVSVACNTRDFNATWHRAVRNGSVIVVSSVVGLGGGGLFFPQVLVL